MLRILFYYFIFMHCVWLTNHIQWCQNIREFVIYSASCEWSSMEHMLNRPVVQPIPETVQCTCSHYMAAGSALNRKRYTLFANQNLPSCEMGLIMWVYVLSHFHSFSYDAEELRFWVKTNKFRFKHLQSTIAPVASCYTTHSLPLRSHFRKKSGSNVGWPAGY